MILKSLPRNNIVRNIVSDGTKTEVRRRRQNLDGTANPPRFETNLLICIRRSAPPADFSNGAKLGSSFLYVTLKYKTERHITGIGGSNKPDYGKTGRAYSYF